jgi:hypothetical protein
MILSSSDPTTSLTPIASSRLLHLPSATHRPSSLITLPNLNTIDSTSLRPKKSVFSALSHVEAMPDDRNPKAAKGTPQPDKAEKQAAAHQAVDILHEISTILVRGSPRLNSLLLLYLGTQADDGGRTQRIVTWIGGRCQFAYR